MFVPVVFKQMLPLQREKVSHQPLPRHSVLIYLLTARVLGVFIHDFIIDIYDITGKVRDIQQKLEDFIEALKKER